MPGPTEQIVERLVREMTAWSSIQIEVREEIVDRPDAAPDDPKHFRFIDYKYVETALGQRYLDMRATQLDHSVFHLACTTDGRLATVVTFSQTDPDRQDRISLGKYFGMNERHGQTDRPPPIAQRYVGLEPLHEVISRGTITGSSAVIGRDCTVVTVEGVRYGGPPGILELHLDGSTSVPLKIVFTKGPSRPEWTWEADELATIQGFHVPIKSHYIDTTRGSEAHLISRREYTVRSVAFNESYPRATFIPVPQNGVPIHGRPADIERVYGKKALRPESSPVPRPETATSAAGIPVTATPSQPWFATVAQASFGLGVIMLLCGVVARCWVRRRENRPS